MRNYLNKGMLALIGLSIIYACSKDENSEPETPQTTDKSPTGKETSIFFRLCSLAPFTFR